MQFDWCIFTTFLMEVCVNSCGRHSLTERTWMDAPSTQLHCIDANLPSLSLSLHLVCHYFFLVLVRVPWKDVGNHLL